MTVHGAKGLEAPIVILADTMTPPAGPRPPRLLELAGGAVIWAGRKEDDVPSVAAAREAAKSEAENEYRRLLYVAMTRAADRLIVCGAEGRTKRPERCWYDLVRGPLEAFLVEEDDGGEKVLRFRKTPAGAVAAHRAGRRLRKNSRGANFRRGCGSRRPPKRRVPRRCRRRRPSTKRLCGARQRAGSAADRQKALERGRLVHRLMQSLPDIPADAPPGCRRALSRQCRHGLSPGRTGRDGATSPRHPRRQEFCRNLCAGKPRRSADRRPHRARGTEARSRSPGRWTASPSPAIRC